jgi:hypothetical protein
MKFSYSTAEFTDVSASTGLASVAAIHQRATSSSAMKIWALARTGQIAESSDGVTFTPKFAGTFATQGSTTALVAADDAGTAFAAFERYGQALQTTVAGKWVSTPVTGCQIRSVAPIGANWIIGCMNSVPRFLAR